MSNRPLVSGTTTSSNNFNRQLTVYSLAAASAGVSLMALSSPASGEVVITKKTIPIHVEESVLITMANTGTADFILSLRSTFSSISTQLVRSCQVKNAGSANAVMYAGTHIAYASALARGTKIRPSARFGSLARIEESRTLGNEREFYGQWGSSVKNRYLGVRFVLDGKTHYGWIRLTVTTNQSVHGPFMSAAVTAYAYETVPNKPIKAGTAASTASQVKGPHQVEPSLGILAAGAEGLPLWRREENVNSK